MSKFFVKISCVMVVLSLVFVPMAFAQTEEAEPYYLMEGTEPNYIVEEAEPDYTITEVYQYPIVPGMEEWAKFESLQEMIEACQIPEDVLNNMTTEALIETVLNYPLAINIVAYDTPQIGLEEVKKYFNGLQELCTRTDAANMLELTTSQNAFGRSSNSLQKVFSSVISENFQNRSIIAQAPMSEGNQYDYTPAGTKVTFIYNATWADHGMTTADGADWQKFYKSTYPNATVVSSENPAYNCHSYTFYSTSTSNKYWLEPPYAAYYITDGSYNSVSPAKAGDKVWYGSYHSAIIKSVSSGTVTVRSKWGYAGVFEHTVAYCPYNSNNGVTYYR